ncbi:50S ribosomal protein L24 [Candidatus Daviesbacteria bacterium]|nr:50S ribosomal protein L24 [Candidatus Daviesbacteria bacterium]
MSKIRKGDKVKILLGKDRGKTGAIEKVLVQKSRVLVSGVNLVKRHVKKQGTIEGGIIDIAKPVNISNVMLICPSCNLPTRVGFKIGAEKARICKKCKKEI